MTKRKWSIYLCNCNEHDFMGLVVARSAFEAVVRFRKDAPTVFAEEYPCTLWCAVRADPCGEVEPDYSASQATALRQGRDAESLDSSTELPRGDGLEMWKAGMGVRAVYSRGGSQTSGREEFLP